MLEVGVNLIQAWGMTETSPLATMAWPKYALLDLDADDLTTQVRCQAGIPLTGVDVAIRDNNGKDVWEKGHVPTAKWVSFKDVKESDLPADHARKLVFYCANTH